MEVEELQAILEERGAQESEDIVYSTEDVEEEIEEIVEIIEEIEVVEGEDVEEIDGETEYVTEILEEERDDKQIDNNYENIEAVIESMDSNNENISEESINRITSEVLKTNKQLNYNQSNRFDNVLSYNAEEDWQDEESSDPLETQQQQQQRRQQQQQQQTKNQTIKNKNKNNQVSTMSNGNSPANVYHSAKSKKTINYGTMQIPRHDDVDDDMEINTVIHNAVIDEEELIEDDEDEDDNPHQIVKNAENNLIYTVLGTSNKKKHDSKHITDSSNKNSQYVKMERLDEGTVPMEGTIYYEGDDMGTLYVAQSYNENEQYFDEQTIETEEENQQLQQEQQQDLWDESNDIVMTEEQDQEHEEEDTTENQIFLHQDEEGNLFYKDENGVMQPVYMTEDGNYAFQASNDDQDLLQQNANDMSIQEYDGSTHRQVSSPDQSQNVNEDNENDTVTISLIISEDENGLKRTQVIIPTNDPLKCDICQKTFKTQFQLLKHARLKHAREEDITVRNFPCDLCPKRFPDQNSLAKHRKIHTGNRPFQCLECHKQFPSSEVLRAHMNDHNPNSKPLPCIYCGRRFMDKQTLNKHEESHTAGENNKSHNCDICHKSFVTAGDLSLHKKNHDPNKKFDCEVCGRVFNRLNNLQRHMLVHQQTRGKQPAKGTQNQEILSCDICGITYKFASSLTRHVVTSHVDPEKKRQQAEEQRRKRENSYKRYLENRKTYETQDAPVYGKRSYKAIEMGTYDDDEEEEDLYEDEMA